MGPKIFQRVLLVLVLVYTVALCSSYAAKHTPTDQVVVLDAGSSGTRLHVYEYNRSEVIDSLTEILTKKVTPGLSSYAKSPEDVRTPLEDLLSFAIGSGVSPKHTRVFLRATAGFRILPESDQQALIYSVRGVLEKSPFVFESAWASIISGEHEAVLDFVTANLLHHRATGEYFGSAGAIDMGGASVQITFPCLKEDCDFGHTQAILVAGHEYNIYRRSDNWYGLNEAYAKLTTDTGNLADPCVYEGTNGKEVPADFSKCREAVVAMVEPMLKAWPKIPRFCGKFYLYDHFSTYLTMTMGTRVFSSDLHHSRASEICSKHISIVENEFGMSGPKLMKSCFGFAYIDVILEHVMTRSGSNCLSDSSFEFRNPIPETRIGDVSWAPGEGLLQAYQSVQEKSA